MADRSLDFQVKLGERLVVFADLEKWIVPESGRATSFEPNTPAAASVRFQLDIAIWIGQRDISCLLYTSPSPRD